MIYRKRAERQEGCSNGKIGEHENEGCGSQFYLCKSGTKCSHIDVGQTKETRLLLLELLNEPRKES
jgi:hypothetical protein